MLISISGPQGSGKSTLIKGFMEIRSDVKLIERKTARSVLKDMGITLEDVYESRHTQMSFQLALLHRKSIDEFDAYQDFDSLWITERSFADIFAYTVGYLGKHNDNNQMIDEFYEEAEIYQNRYNAVIYLPGGHFDIFDDGVRPINKHYGRLIDHFTYDTAKLMCPDRVYAINDVNINTRVEVMNKIIQDIS